MENTLGGEDTDGNSTTMNVMYTFITKMWAYYRRCHLVTHKV